MNPDNEVPAPEPSQPAPPQAPPTPRADAPPGHRPRGKIARLAPPIREKLNQLLDEGLPYADIITRLASEAPGLSETNICRWYKSGYQDWRKNQLWLEQTRSRLDFAIDVIAENEGSNVHQANLHVAATQLIANLITCGQTLLDKAPEQYVSLVNSISRLSREALCFQKYREACALAHAELIKLRDPNRKLSEQETLAIVDKLDEILGFK
jgi:hypothetical protein